MKKLYLRKWIIIIAVYSFSNTLPSQANWLKSEGKSSTPYAQHIPNTSESTQHSNSDSLPKGVTKDWLNTLTDEKGKRIIPETDPETDALLQNTFDGNAAGVNYGKSVSNAGDVNGDGFDDVIIGDPNGNGGGGTNSGRAYIYFGGSVINTSADVILTGETVNNFFGSSVSNAGDVNSDGYDDVIVGAYGYNSFTGRAYIYFGGASVNNTADVILTGEFTGNNFGNSVSGAGDVNGDGFSDVITGSFAANVYTGKAYIYYGGSTMNNIADIIMTGENSNDNFGYSVSGAGDVNGDGYRDVICGAFGFNGIGRAYIYFGGSAMDNTADVTMLGGGLVDFFGASVSGAGDVNDDGYSDVIIGAYGYNSTTGRAYIYYGGASMNSIADVTMTGEAVNNLFGYSVSDAGDVNGDGYADVYVGAYGFSSSKGRAYLYYGGADMNNVVDIYMTGEESLNYFGYSVSGGGDVNGDGFADMIAGAYGYNSNTGRVYVYTNTVRGVDIPDNYLEGESSFEHFGVAVSNAGDVNGDGYDDLIVGANQNNGGGSSSGRAYIYYGGIFFNAVPDVILTGQNHNGLFGSSVSGAGDVNGDSYNDVIVGGAGFGQNSGKQYIFFGGVSMDNSADVIFTVSSVPGILAGQTPCAGAGDLNGDGYDDVIAGDYSYLSRTGRAMIYFGGSAMDSIPDVSMIGESGSDFGFSVSSAGDVNNDGYSDVIIGAQSYDINRGRAYIFLGGAFMNNIADVTLTGETQSTWFGSHVSDAGDVNGDGYSDVIIGAPINPGGGNIGNAYIFYGGLFMNTVPDVRMQGDGIHFGFGGSVSEAGDVNGDGYTDVIVGAYGYNGSNGRAYVFYGGITMDNDADIFMNDVLSAGEFASAVSGGGDINNDGYSDLVVGAYNDNNFIGRAYVYLSSPPDNKKNLLFFGAIQGLYDPVPDTEVPDTIKVYLRNSTSPFTRVDSSKNILLGPQAGQNFLFRNVQNDRPYYIEVTHRNALTTWSADPVTFVNSDASVAFSVNSNYAYGDNEIQVDNNPYDVFAFYSGDVNQDGFIDLTDVLTIYNGTNNFLTGYVVTDLTGDSIVDLTDILMAYNNSVKFVSVIRP